jgi:soluble lytic murein transglycosylase-like protein
MIRTPSARARLRPVLGRVVASLLGAAAVLGASTAHAEIVKLAGGGILSIAGHREEGASLVLALRGGGEVTCSRDAVLAILPDEVPYPKPQPSEPAAVGPAAESPLSALIETAATRHGLEPRLLESVIRVESNFSHRARSRKGAMGLMQLMPATARQYALRNPYDPAGNIEAGARHLRRLLDRFELPVALAAYNAGEAAVERYGGIPPYRETRAYVARILRLVRHPSAPSSR